MRIIKLFTTIAAVLALMALPMAAQARGHHRARAAGVVRSFKHGVLSIRVPGRGVKSADVSEGTDLTCEPSARERRRQRRQRRRARRHGARAAQDLTGDSGDDGADDPAGDDPGGEDGSDDLGNQGSDDPNDNAGDDEVTDDNEADDPAADEPHGAKPGCTLSALRRGAKVKVAKLGSDRSEWAKIVLVRR